jgi:plastocyanin
MKIRILLFIAVSLFYANCNKNSNPPKNEVYLNTSLFDPTTITVSIGTTIKWTNKESVTHTVTSDSGVFNSGNLTQSQTFSFTFNTAGTFPYHCIYHSNMKGTVIVQ